MLVEKRSAQGDVQITYPGAVVQRAADMVVIHATWQQPERDLGYTIFAPGDRFTEYFYADQWFNVMRIDAAATGALRGWYCNITHPAAITADVVSYRDLYLDVWVRPDGAQLTLDEEEFAAADLDAATRAGALAGLAEVRRWAARGLGPFSGLAAG